jgi:hypothetical protein
MYAQLLVDQVSASLEIPEADLRAWTAGRRVFVSSLITDLANERAAVRVAVFALGATPVMFEDELGAQDVPADRAYLAGVRSSQIYLGLWGERYGVRMSDGFSATHAEFLEAERAGLRLCLFVRGEASGEMDGAQRDLVASARNSWTTSSWTSPEDLADRVRRRLRDLASEEIAPWVRVGRAVFRATRIDYDGSAIGVTADIRSGVINAELDRMRHQRAGDVPFAAPHLARRVQVVGLASAMVATGAQSVRLDLTVQDGGNAAMRWAMNGRSAAEVGRESLAAALFKTPPPSESQYFGSTPDPLEPIRGMGLDDAVVRPVARLLLTEHLLLNEDAASVDAFILGPQRQGRRRLLVAWTPRRVHANEPYPAPLSIEGEVAGI